MLFTNFLNTKITNFWEPSFWRTSALSSNPPYACDIPNSNYSRRFPSSSSRSSCCKNQEPGPSSPKFFRNHHLHCHSKQAARLAFVSRVLFLWKFRVERPRALWRNRRPTKPPKLTFLWPAHSWTAKCAQVSKEPTKRDIKFTAKFASRRNRIICSPRQELSLVASLVRSPFLLVLQHVRLSPMNINTNIMVC